MGIFKHNIYNHSIKNKCYKGETYNTTNKDDQQMARSSLYRVFPSKAKTFLRKPFFLANSRITMERGSPDGAAALAPARPCKFAAPTERTERKSREKLGRPPRRAGNLNASVFIRRVRVGGAGGPGGRLLSIPSVIFVQLPGRVRAGGEPPQPLAAGFASRQIGIFILSAEPSERASKLTAEK